MTAHSPISASDAPTSRPSSTRSSGASPSDRRKDGGGLALLSKVSPPPGKVVKIIAVARSDEHVFNLEGGRGTKSGQPARGSGDYTLNSEGQVHSALIGTETLSLVIYRGEPQQTISFE